MSSAVARMSSHPPAHRHPPLPEAARWLGYAGLLPFVLGALLLWVLVLAKLDRPEPHAFAALALSGYAAVVIAFLGALHWGLAMQMPAPPPSLLVWGVVPALVAWVAVVMPAYAGLVVHGVMLVACYVVDRRVYPAHQLEHWLTLRFRLTAVAAFCCFFGAAYT